MNIIKTFRKYFLNTREKRNNTYCLEILGNSTLRGKISAFYRQNEDDILYIEAILGLLKKERGNVNALTAREFVNFFKECDMEVENQERDKKKRNNTTPPY
jgi:hypothetical protein